MVKTVVAAAALWMGVVECATAVERAGTVPAGAATASPSRSDPSTTAAALVDQAIAAGVEGDYARRERFLAQAVQFAPDYSPARWQLGQVVCDGQWVSVAEAQRRAADNPSRQQRADALRDWQESPAAHRQAAHWCRDHGLEDEARYHWTMLLRSDRDNREALDALDARWIGGELVPNSQVAELRETQRQRTRTVRDAKSLVAGWETRIGRGDTPDAKAALDEVRAFDRLDAIPAIEAVTLAPAPARSSKAAARRRLALAFVEALKAHPDQAATESLARHALASPFEEVRDEAAWELAERPWHNFVPMLLDGLEPEVELWQNVSVTPGGDVHYQAEIEVEGREADYGFDVRDSVWTHDLAGSSKLLTRDGSRVFRVTPTGSRLSDARAKHTHDVNLALGTFNTRAAVVAATVEQQNQQRTARNAELIGVLIKTTGHELGDEPRPWWEWWKGLNEYQTAGDRPYYRQESVGSIHNCYRCPEVVRMHSCFTAGTPVWTKTGKQPIESVRPGDFVLSQDVATGELGYQPVLETTHRPAGPMMRVEVAGESIELTPGHPVWVVGDGWRMAKELAVGDRLQHVAGDAEVMESVVASPAEAYNLVVAETSTYFVGYVGLLAHDITPRRPTSVKAPGWRRD